MGVEVTASSTDGAVKKVRRGNGLVLRCDGFVLVPTALFNATVEVAGTKEEGQIQIAIVVRPGMEGEKRLAAHRPRYERAGLGYTVVKIGNWHGVALTTETPQEMKRGEHLDIYWTDYDPTERKWLPIKRKVAAAGSMPAEADKQRPGRRPFAEALERVPPGALVCSQAMHAVGVIVSGTEKGTEEFEGFDALGLATNCVVPETPLPHGEAGGENGAAPAAGPAPVAASDMVKVPGGPVMLPASVIQMQPDMEGAKYACVAPFEIDKFEVTNKQYMEFWKGLPEDKKKELWFQSQFWPTCWSKRGQAFPTEIADFPVLGVPMPGAEAFARSQGSDSRHRMSGAWRRSGGTVERCRRI